MTFKISLIGFVFLACFGAAPRSEKPSPLQATAETKKDAQGNTNALVKAQKDKIKVTASSFWPGWPPELVIDGNLAKSWFTQRGDTAVNKAQKTAPWIRLEFPEAVTIRRVTVHGNREEPWAKGFSFLAAKLELLDADGNVIATDDNDGTGDHKDYDFRYAKPVEKVRFIRVTALGDEGDKNQFDDVSIGEIETE